MTGASPVACHISRRILSLFASETPHNIVQQPPGGPGPISRVSFPIVLPVSVKLQNSVTKFASKWVSAQTREAVWEDPDDGSGSDYEDDDDGENELEWSLESNSGGESDSGFTSSREARSLDTHYPEFIEEVELVLDPEEKVILQQNESPDLSKISTRKWSPFHTLALSGQIPFMDMLVEHGVDINDVDKDGYTALHKAVMGKKEAVISHLLRKGANPHARDYNGVTPLHYAVQVGAIQTVKLLIKYGVDVNVADDEGWTPLHVAMQSRSRDIAKVLLVNGADRTRRNKVGKTPLDLSLCFGKDFKSYELAKLVKLVPENREL